MWELSWLTGCFHESELAVSDSVSSFDMMANEKVEGGVRELLRSHVEKRARLHEKAQPVSGIVRVRVGAIVVLGLQLTVGPQEPTTTQQSSDWTIQNISVMEITCAHPK